MEYVKVWTDGWKDHTEGGTPIDAAALNHMESGIVANAAAITQAQEKLAALMEHDSTVLQTAQRYADQRFTRLRAYVDEKTMGTQSNAEQSLQEFRETLRKKVDSAYLDEGYLYLTAAGAVVGGPYGPFAGAGSGEVDTSALEDAVRALQASLSRYADDLEVTDGGLVYLLNNGIRIVGPYGPFTGGGGGGNSIGNVSYNVSNETGWISTTIADGSPCNIKISWYSTENNLSTGDGALQVSTGSSQASLSVKTTRNVPQGEIELDLAAYLSSGSNAVRVTVTDIYGNSRYVVFNVEVVSLSLASSFSPQVFTGAVVFPYTPVGSGQKTVYFLVNGEIIGSNSTAYSNRQLTYTIPRQAHGAHTLDCCLGVEYLLKQVVGVENVTVVSDYQTYTTGFGRRLYPDRNQLNYISKLDVDYVVLARPVLSKYFLTLWKDILIDLEKRGVRYVILSAGMMKMTEDSLKECQAFFGQHPPFIVSSRSHKTYETFGKYAEYAYDGICFLFYTPDYYQPAPIADKFIIMNFDKTLEPKVWINEGSSPDSFEFEGHQWHVKHEGLLTRTAMKTDRFSDALIYAASLFPQKKREDRIGEYRVHCFQNRPQISSTLQEENLWSRQFVLRRPAIRIFGTLCKFSAYAVGQSACLRSNDGLRASRNAFFGDESCWPA